MGRKVLMSFLGTGNYLECNYYYGDEKVPNVKYIQEAIVKIFCKNWSENDVAYIFVTKDAEQIHWDSLKGILNKFHFKTTKISIPDCRSEEDLWKLFDILVEQIQMDDEIIFDITHSFRFMPMFAMAAINYLDSIRNIKSLGIYYGAFEVLGRLNEVATVPLEKRNAPIFDLSTVHYIQKWAKATEVFSKTGRSQYIKEASEEKYSVILKETRGKDRESQKLKNLVEKIYKFAQNVATARSKDVIDFDFKKLKSEIKEIKNQNTILPLNPIIEQLEKSFENFNDNLIQNSFAIIDWCIQYDLIQQGYTYLVETVYSYLLELTNTNCNLWDSETREELSKKSDAEISKVTNSVFSGKFRDLRQYRNDINHCGYRKNPVDFETLKKKLIDYNEYFKKVILKGV